MKITEQAIAYLKGSPSEDGRPVVTLSPKDSPVVRPYSGDLHVCYLVDNGQSYGYIQNRHLEDDGISADDLHQIGLRNLKTSDCPKKRQGAALMAMCLPFWQEVTSRRASCYWTNFGRVNFGNSSPANMQQPYQRATCWLSAMRNQQTESPNYTR